MRKFTCFVAGAALGFAAASIITKRKYENLIAAEIESVKDAYKTRFESADKGEECVHPDKDVQPSMDDMKKEYEDTVTTYYKQAEYAPHIISPYELGCVDGYAVVGLTYFADDVLAHESGVIIEDIANTVGEDALTQFGEYEIDAVHIRNNKLKTDYEILLDERTYSEVFGTKIAD